MATIKTLLGNVKGKDGRGYEEVILYDGDCSACINWNVISADSPMMELSDSIENYKSIRIEFTSYNGIGTGGEEEGIVTTSTTYSVNYIKTTYIHSGLECSTGFGNSYYSRQAFGFYDNKHLVLTWEEYSGWEHNISHITVTGIRDRVSDAEKNFNKYSTTEEVIGTWIDGKPIYRKTFNNISVTSSEYSVISIATGLTIDNLINVSGYLVNNGRWIVTLNAVDIQYANMARVSYDKQTSSLELIAQNWTGTAIVTIEYTKTTD